MNEWLQSYSTTHTNTLKHTLTHPSNHSKNSIQHLADRVLSPASLQLPFTGTPVLFDGSPPARDGPGHHATPSLSCLFTWSSILIPHPQILRGHSLCTLAPADICVCIWLHERYPGPRSRLQMGRECSFGRPFFGKQMSF